MALFFCFPGWVYSNPSLLPVLLSCANGWGGSAGIQTQHGRRSAPVPYGALKIGVYEVYEMLLGTTFARWGFSKFMKSMMCGAVAGVTTGLLARRRR